MTGEGSRWRKGFFIQLFSPYSTGIFPRNTCDEYFLLSLGLGSQKGVLAKAMIRGGYIETLNNP